MIKGQNISELMIIKDTTSGGIVLWIMVIMLISIYIVYCASYLTWMNKMTLRLQSYRGIIKKGNEKITSEKIEKKEINEEKEEVLYDTIVFKKKKRSIIPERKQEENFEKEMYVFQSLKRKKW